MKKSESAEYHECRRMAAAYADGMQACDANCSCWASGRIRGRSGAQAGVEEYRRAIAWAMVAPVVGTSVNKLPYENDAARSRSACPREDECEFSHCARAECNDCCLAGDLRVSQPLRRTHCRCRAQFHRCPQS